jgi:hypothetical protein
MNKYLSIIRKNAAVLVITTYFFTHTGVVMPLSVSGRWVEIWEGYGLSLCMSTYREVIIHFGMSVPLTGCLLEEHVLSPWSKGIGRQTGILDFLTEISA